MRIFIGNDGAAFNLQFAQYLFVDHATNWQVSIQWAMDPFPTTLIAEFASETEARAAVGQIASDPYVLYSQLQGTL